MLENRKAQMLNSKASRDESKASEIVAALGIKKGMRVADIGSGGGHFSFLFSAAVGDNGKAYMSDTDSRMLDYAMGLAKEKGLNNIEPILASERDPRLPEGAIDLVFIRSACHHMKNRGEYFASLKKSLAPGGKVALIDYRKGGFFDFRWLKGHYVEESVVKNEMGKAGFALLQSHDFIKRQWFMVFSP